MAKFEKGRPKNRHFWETSIHGTVLTAREWSTFDDRLRGYRALPSAAAAQAEQSRLAAQKLGEGYVPADDAARALAATLPESPAKTKPGALPLRQDIHVYNEGTGFLVTSGRLAGQGLENGGKKWVKAVAAGDLMPLGLIQDDSFLIRVVVGDDLSAQEQEEWVGRVDSPLKVPDGKLVISAVAAYVEDGYEEGGDLDEFVRVIEIPKGHYDATIYAYLPGVNGAPCLDALAAGREKMERVGAWLRRTRPGTAFPGWMRRWCIGDPGDDPGHEAEWKGLEYPDDDALPEYVHFLLHLRPSEPTAKPTPPAGLLEGGWFGETSGARKPERCPLGLVALDVIGHESKDSGEWIYARDVKPEVEPFEPKALSSPVEIDVSRAGHVSGLAWLANTRSLPALRVTLPEGSAFEVTGDWPEGLVIFRDRDVIHALPNSDANGPVCRRAMAALGPRLEDVPEGTILEVLCAPIDQGKPKEGDGGLQRYRGAVSSGVWRIDACFPPVPPDRLRAALALANELDRNDVLAVRDEDEARAILKWLRGNFGPYAFEDNPPRFDDGVIRLQKAARGLLWMIGSAAFGVRFRDVFPVTSLADDDEEDGEEDGDEAVAKPIQGARLLEAPSGRVYFQSMALMLSESLAAIIQKRERELFGLRFRHVGDLVCSAFPNIVVRAYAQPDGDTWASYLVAAPDVVRVEMSTRFERGNASLATLEGPGVDDEARASFRQSLPGVKAAVMLEAHDKRKADLAEKFGPPVKLTITMRGLAESVEAALAKQ